MIKPTSSISQVIKQLEDHKIAVDEALDWMAYKGEYVRLSYDKTNQKWECVWQILNVMNFNDFQGMRGSVLGCLNKALPLFVNQNTM